MKISRLAIPVTGPVVLLAILSLIAGPTEAFAKTVGLIIPRDCAFSTDTQPKFEAAMADQGFPGDSLEIFTQRPGSDKVSRLNSMRKFLAYGVDVIVVWGGTSLKEFVSEAGKSPIVFVGVWDPVGSGIIPGLRHPGKYITGVTGRTSTSYLLDNIIESSGTRVLGILFHSDIVDSKAQYKTVKNVASTKGLELLEVDLHATPLEKASSILEPAAFLYMAQGCDVEDGSFKIMANFNKPAATQNPGVTGDGVIFTLAPDFEETIKVAAGITARILKGEKPGDIPVARATKINFTINMGEARKLGIKIPFPVLKRGTRIIR